MKFFIKKESFFLKKFIQTLNQEKIPLEIIDTKGNKYSTAPHGIKHKIFIKDQKFFNALICPDAFSLGEAYVKGYFDISGSIKELYELVCDKLLNTDQRKSIVTFFSSFFVKAKKKEKENIEYHYNVSSDFYRLFLGKTMGYTCGYYTSERATMDDAQNEKMDIICRKLRLKKGDKLLDIGCGWGNFAVYAAKHYGVNVSGITLSSKQKKYAENWIEKEGLSHKINIKILNYRDLGSQIFDKISCVGMSEHVGKSNMSVFFKTVYNSLKKGGLFMQHTITTNNRRKKGFENSFMDKYMFPGGELMLEQDLLDLASSSGFELLNAENFRTHYVRTLNDWILMMERHKDKLQQIVSDNIYRIYHVFFIGSLISFKTKEISLFQNLFYKTDCDNNSTEIFLSPYAKNETRIV
ncbi:class I SAM-dependent methyltransferase [Desulfobacula toluolica]|uniref:Cfa: cyclopropane-fatty-acyl-phospholipid synthase n=1 Tax=Desulfobacula toluolica (strain DSM 7467 / Tol2) TaxID=651182 RepID=K0NHU5_DESTT|nr:class I SAM-dependent methyltransferase [Desulfobacula toluolica]CCK80505.1 Cfa: cyclopropane-fatty-acyl-phospholipid synthase [Desulfobacula toluolica Tol2]